MKISKIIFIVAILNGCYNNSDPKPNIVVPDDVDFCKPGCEHIATLPGPDGLNGCLESRPLIYPDGKSQSCENFCIETEKNGRALEPKCWVNISKCDEIENCRK